MENCGRTIRISMGNSLVWICCVISICSQEYERSNSNPTDMDDILLDRNIDASKKNFENDQEDQN